ncbi:uncharacterized protein LOC112574602 isoform X1 [Pomacea canaliculata]|uniref:uncharacterized protein LOC112574602 isoform X1 n=2 Tax=Pomacea canaliculata TaxID=400727 RepID=UPI000D73F4E2|nr:uncharacterized protein LOC112574602 isoform X1 [Pomacea canaliculata]
MDSSLDSSSKSSLPYHHHRRHVKMTEWLAQYERVAQRQQEYLKRIQDLRQQLQSRERHMLLTIERMRSLPRHHSLTQNGYDFLPTKRNYMVPPAVSQSWPCQTFHQKAGLFPPGAPRLESDGTDNSQKGVYSCFISGERLLPKMTPNKLTLVTSRRHQKSNPVSDTAAKFNNSVIDMTLERNKTDYEPIEEIAKRNRIHFSRYLKSREEKRVALDLEIADREGGQKRHSTTERLSTLAVCGDDMT